MVFTYIYMYWYGKLVNPMPEPIPKIGLLSGIPNILDGFWDYSQVFFCFLFVVLLAFPQYGV